jgi:hypothetical protein
MYCQAFRRLQNEVVKISILKGSDDGLLQSGLLILWTLSIVLYSKKTHDVSKAGSAFVLKCTEEGHLFSWVHLNQSSGTFPLRYLSCSGLYFCGHLNMWDSLILTFYFFRSYLQLNISSNFSNKIMKQSMIERPSFQRTYTLISIF